MYICHNKCHLNGVHKNASLDIKLKTLAQQVAMEHYKWSKDDFRAVFGKNYIDNGVDKKNE